MSNSAVTPLVFAQDLDNIGEDETDFASVAIYKHGPPRIRFALTAEHPVDAEASTSSTDMTLAQTQALILMLQQAIVALSQKEETS